MERTKQNKEYVQVKVLLLIFARSAPIVLRLNVEFGNSPLDTWSGRTVVLALFVTQHPLVCVAPARECVCEAGPVSVYTTSGVNRSRGFCCEAARSTIEEGGGEGGRRNRCFSSSHVSRRGMSAGRRRVWPLVCFFF